MFLVEIETGREQLFQSVDALGAAIRGGVIGPDAKIFHRASGSWISITLHPEYRKVKGTPPDAPLPPMARTQWTFYGNQPPTRQVADTGEADAGAKPAPPAGPRGLRALLNRVRRNAASDPAGQTGS